ncbi:MAG TPA: DnaA regulatory inactivator Hda [Rudaea sp.]|nr:DnaA regulatory inactivator Hda [Rudaea sp.]
MSAQLPLALRWPAQQRFDSYVAGENGAGVDAVRHAAEAGGAWAYLHGPAGCGKTHLLIAACAAAAAAGRSAQYLPLAKLGAGAGDVLRGVGGSELLAIDDLAAAGRDVEHALFDLYNRCKVEKSTLLFAAAAAPAQLGLGLPDLVSRLSACTQLALKPLDEATRRDAVRRRAAARGLVLDDAVLDWLFAHSQRDLGSLTALVERLDRESLAAKRRITVPFLRKVLGRDG